MNHLIEPHGGTLVNLLVEGERAREIRECSREWPSIDLGQRELCDLELLLDGGFSPLAGFMGSADAASVCRDLRLTNGTFWPLPMTLGADESTVADLDVGVEIALRDAEGVMLAALTVSEVFEPDREAEAEAVFGDAESRRSARARFLRRAPRFAVAGRIEGLQLPVHYDFRELRLTPLELRRKFGRLGWRRVLAYQTHQTMHRSHHASTQAAAQDAGASLLIHPVVGMNTPGDVDHYTRVRCYQEILPHYPAFLARLNLLPMAIRGGGPREAALHAIVHQNHGCTHFVVETNGGGSVLEVVGQPGYGDDEARGFIAAHAGDLEIEMVASEEMVWADNRKRHVAVHEVTAEDRVPRMTGDDVRRRLVDGREIPDWFSFPGVVRELRRRHPGRHSQGFTVFCTGLSGSGKSTIANGLRVKLLELGGRGVTLLDGDLVRKNLSSELGFSKEHRDLNIRRIGFVASEITRGGGIAICAPIAPYDSVRHEVREMVQPCGGFVLVHVSTPLEVCEQRDRKGMYAKARAGIIKEFTGISDPYEVPEDADVRIDTSKVTPDEAVREVLSFLEREGYISAVEAE
ncbi:MAG: bifunctional sulfate adenylyltransferase/adenylylsulfate kinase [Thermoanaerobaculales bacterium]|nr:bifunctional sulfate adenylyltransferase/adenylylsulfate kinase [Thermoanaerobaculales bacterium]